MSFPLLDIRGTLEEIAPQLEAIRGRRIRLIVLSEDETEKGAAQVLGPLDMAL